MLVYAVVGPLQGLLGGELFTGDPPMAGALAAGVVSFYSLAAYAPDRRATAGLLAGVAGMWAGVFASDAVDVQSFVFSAGLIGLAPWLAGRATRARRLRSEALERERDQRARAAASEERQRIARELHDVVAHGVVLMVLQAQGARRILDHDRDRAREALEAIEETGQTALAEIRRSLGVLRDDSAPAELAPQRSLDDLGALVDEMREVGLQVDLRVRGPRRELRDGVDRSAYRIVQEALTNTIKHAGLVPTHVTVSYEPDSLVLEVADEGGGAAGDDGRRRAGAGGDARARAAPRRRARRASRRRPRLRRAGADPGGGMSIRVLLVDDHALARTGFRMVLDTEPDIEVVGEAATGRQAIHSARRLEPDVVLMDVRMPELDGIAATRAIAGAARVLILTTFDLDEYVYDALAAGASGFLLKDVGPDQLTEAIRVVAQGEALLAPTVTRRLIDELVRGGRRRLRAPEALGRADAARARGARAGGAGALQRRDRRAAHGRGDDDQDPRLAPAGEARPPRPRPGGRARLRIRARPWFLAGRTLRCLGQTAMAT